MGSERTTVEHVRQTSLHGLRWRMRRGVIQVSLMLSAVFVASCASSIPPARIGDYLASGRQADVGAFTKIDQRPLQAGLVVVSDTAEPDAAPNLPEEALVRLGENLQRDLGRAIPVAITAVISADRIRPEMHGDWTQFAELGRLRGLDYLAVVVVSSTEQEYPVTLFLGLTTHAQPGFRRDHWSLLEFALLDLKHDQILMQAEGRGWATLDRPSAPGIDQWYPAIFLRPQDERRIWPPSYEGASNTLRVVSFEQAAKRLVLKLQNSWREVVESETTARKARL
ncbi:MAG TPA: hypothetical protein VLL94_10090 [Nitrospiraceae bacterium]|nr:hypothetical protein [Nitrospiraceae bacterium]